MPCGLFDWTCKVEASAASLATNALERLAIAVTETLGELMGTLATSWVRISTPVLIGGGGTSMRSAGEHAGAAAGVETVLGWVMYVSFGIMVLALIAAGVRLASARRDASEHVGRIGIVLLATILVSAAAGIVAAVAPAGSVQGSAPVAYIQASLYWYMLAVAMAGVMVGAVKMAWQQRADAGLDVVASILTLAVVSGAGLTAVSLLTAASDEFAVWVLDGSMGCSLDADGTCFSQAMGSLILNSAAEPTGPDPSGLLTVILGLLAILAVIVQVVLMVVRSAMLVVLSGMLPLAAAATNTEMGGQMFKRTVGWLLGMILYKPAAAIIYAAAFSMVGNTAHADAVMSTITGLTLIVMALIALPALMALIVPATSAVASGGGLGGTAAMAAMAMPSGAIAGRRASTAAGGGSAAPTTGSSGPAGSSRPAGSSGPAGGNGSPGGPTPSPQAGSTGSGQAGGGRAPTGSTPAPTTGAGASTTAGAASTGASGGAGVMASGAAASANPVGAVASTAGQLVDGARRAINNTTNGQAGGPDGAQQ